MRRLFAVLLLVLIWTLIHTFAIGADVPLSWDAVPNATSYKIQMSTDMGLTWAQERPATGTSLVWIGAPDNGLLLFRGVAIGPQGEAIRVDAGGWYNGSWSLNFVKKMGVQ